MSKPDDKLMLLIFEYRQFLAGERAKLPRWERGYRCHGLWAGGKRIAFIGLGPRGLSPVAKPYGWEVKVDCPAQGRAKTLKQTKRAVESILCIAWSPQIS